MDFILGNLFDAYGIPVGIDWKLSLFPMTMIIPVWSL